MASQGDEKPKRRGSGKPFMKGCKPGPGRTPLPADVRQALRDAVPTAIERLIELLGSEDQRIRLEAIKVVFQRVHGSQTVVGNLPDDPAERLKLLEAALHLRGLSGDTAALALSLAALAPEKYGKHAGPVDETPQSITIDFGDPA